MKFRKKPVVIEAIQWNGRNATELSLWSQGKTWGRSYKYLKVDTLEGTIIAKTGDWIIRGIKGEFYPCKPDIFEATYEAVE